MNNILFIKDERIKSSYIKQIVESIKDQNDIILTEINGLNSLCKEFDFIIVDLFDIDDIGTKLIRNISMFTDLPLIVFSDCENKDNISELFKLPITQFLIKSEVSETQIRSTLLWSILKSQEINKLKKLVLIDELTKVYNRRGFYELSEKQFKIAQRINNDVNLFFVDINYLKKINDNFGHFEGDKVIKSVAKALENTFRTSDIISRLGGDEFVVLTVGNYMSNEVFNNIMKRLHDNLAEINVNNPFYNISISVGFSNVYPVKDDNFTCVIKNLLQKADEDLYESKKFKTSNDSFVTLSSKF